MKQEWITTLILVEGGLPTAVRRLRTEDLAVLRAAPEALPPGALAAALQPPTNLMTPLSHPDTHLATVSMTRMHFF